MNRHAGPGSGGGPAPPPEPSYAERARTLVHLARSGMLSTLSRRHPGHPFGSVMPYAPDAKGAPLLLISSMAMPRRTSKPTRARACSPPSPAGRRIRSQAGA